MAKRWPKARKWLDDFVFDSKAWNRAFDPFLEGLSDEEVVRIWGEDPPKRGRKLRRRVRETWHRAFADSTLEAAIEVLVEGFPVWVAQLARHYEGLPRTAGPRQIVAVPRALVCGTAAQRIVDTLGKSAEIERLPGGGPAMPLFVRHLVESLDRAVRRRGFPLTIGEGSEIVGVESHFDWTDAEFAGHYYVTVGWPRGLWGRRRPDDDELRSFEARIAGLSRSEQRKIIEHLGPALREGSLRWVIREHFGAAKHALPAADEDAD